MTNSLLDRGEKESIRHWILYMWIYDSAGVSLQFLSIIIIANGEGTKNSMLHPSHFFEQKHWTHMFIAVSAILI